MRLVFRCFSFLLTLFVLFSGNGICFASQENDLIYKGFKQFLGTIHHYRCDQLRGGLSKNMQYLCSVNDNKYVVRILNEPLALRQREVNTHRMAAYHALAPTIHFYDEHDYFFVIMDFIEGQTLLFDDANRPDVLDLLVHKVRTITQLDDSVPSMDLRGLMVRYYQKIREYADPVLDFILQSALSAFEVVCNSIEKEYRPLVFGHNDLHPRNIFCTQDTMMIIDWEMSAPNYELYDLANYAVYACCPGSDRCETKILKNRSEI